MFPAERSKKVADSTEKQNLLRWFTLLHALQDACSFNTSVKTMTLLEFANATITTTLPSANEQQQFINNVTASNTGLMFSTDDLSNSTSFEALLDLDNPLASYVGLYLRTLASGTYPSGSFADFLDALISSAFPGGSSGPAWTNAMGGLTSVIPAVCLSARLQAAVAKTVDDATKKVSDVVNQIATLG